MSGLTLLNRHATVVWLGTLVLVVLGLVSAHRMPSGIYPEVEFPRIVVVARGGGAPADVFLSTITRPIEQQLTSVMGVQRVRSKTIRGSGEISLQFAPDTDLWRALQLVESRIAEVRTTLPVDTEIIVERVTTGSFPVVTFNVSGPVDPRDLREVAELVVRPALANVEGVGRIEVLGGDVREFEVIVDPERAAELGLGPSGVAQRLRSGTGLRAVGRVDRDRQLVTVTTDAQPNRLSEIRDLPIVTTPSGGTIALGRIAEVVEGAEDRLVRIGGPGGETVAVAVARLPGASTPEVVSAALAATRALSPSLPPGVRIDPVYDQASLVTESMASVRDAILLGIALCSAVIALFLRDLRAGSIAALTVPVTLSISFLVMRLGHQTLNLMSLGGMAVAIGLVVDDAIVMVEAIARERDEGADAAGAAAAGTAALAPAVIGTTLTTVVVFIPLAVLDGVVGDFFRALSFTVTAAVLVSLVVALVLVPLAAARFFSSRPRTAGASFERTYRRFVERVVRHPGLAALAFVALLGAGVASAPWVGRGFLPSMDEGAFVIDYFLPAGTSLGTTEHFARALEAELRATPEVVTFTRRTGAELGPAAATLLSRGDVMVRLRPRAERKRSSDDVIADVRARIVERYPELRVEFLQVLQDVLNDLAGNPRPIEVKLFGPDYAKLHELGGALSAELGHIPGLVDVYDGHERDAPELRLVLKRDVIARLGLTPEAVSTGLSDALLGTVVGTVRRFDRLVNVRVRLPNPLRFDAGRMLDQPFTSAGGTLTLRAVADARTRTSPTELAHEALQPMVDVTGDHEQRDLGSVADDVAAAVARLPLPTGYRAVVGGQIEAQHATLRELAAVGAAAVLLVLTVLAAQFSRFRLAVLVLCTVPTAIVGALLGLLVTGTPLNASSLMGCVLLVGLVVKNGVLLLEEAERLARLGEAAVVAVARASERRLRPVVMTTLATLAGLLPLALGIGSGAELQRPLAIAVIGGLLTSTLTTLGLLPPFAVLALGSRRR